MIPSTMHTGMFRDLSILTHSLWGLMAQRTGFVGIRYGPIYLVRNCLCPCMVCASIRAWYKRTSFWGGDYVP